MNKSLLCLCLGLSPLLATSAMAEDGDELSGVYVAPMIGAYFYDAKREDLYDPTLGTLAVGYKFANRLATEASYSQFNEKDGSKGNLWSISGLYYLTDPTKTRPFLLLGAGEIAIQPDMGSNSRDAQVNGGAGVNYALTEHLDLRAEARAVYSDDSDTVDMLAQFGISYLFGRSSSKNDEPAEVVDGDDDGDGVANSKDQCPNSAPGETVDSSGCALAPVDADADGVMDNADDCLDTPKGAKVDARGCNEMLKETVTVTLDVKFATGKAELASEYDSETERLANFLRQYPDTPVAIEGFTDNTGNSALNQQLSEQRAATVRNQLIEKHGIAAERITATGYGEANPIASNDTAEGRKQNRRVVCVVKGTKEVQAQ